MAYTEVDALTLPDVEDDDLFNAVMVLIHDSNFKDKTLGNLRDAIKKSAFTDGVKQIKLDFLGEF